MRIFSTNKGTALMAVFLFLSGSNLLAQTDNTLEKQQDFTSKSVSKIETEKATSTAASFQLSTVNEPQGSTLEAQIARAEFYKAQYTHDAATQAKYQQSIDALKKELAKTSTTKND